MMTKSKLTGLDLGKTFSSKGGINNYPPTTPRPKDPPKPQSPVPSSSS